MGEGHARIGGGGECGGHARDDLKRDAGLDEGLGLFATAAKDEGIAALEAHDVFAGASETDEDAFDLALGAAEATALLADKHPFSGGIGQRQNLRSDQVVVHNGVRLTQQTEGFARQKLRIAGTGADQEDGAGEANLSREVIHRRDI